MAAVPAPGPSAASATPPEATGPASCGAGREDAPPTCAVVWLHGLGDTDEYWRNRFQRLPADVRLASCAWLHPLAPEGPVRFRAGAVVPRWCDTWGDPDSTSWVDDPDDVASSVALVHEFLSEQLPVDASRVVLGGFSQGGAVALLAALSFPRRLAGCAIYGGWLSYPTAEKVASGGWVHDSNLALPVWWGHGEHDRCIPACLLDEHSEVLDHVRPVAVEKQHYSGGHFPKEQAMSDMLEWMRRVLGQGPRADSRAGCAHLPRQHKKSRVDPRSVFGP